MSSRVASQSTSPAAAKRERALAWALAAGYLALLSVALFVPLAPRVFWTIIMPSVPLFIVVVGFHSWRRVCPIATIGTLGLRLHARGRRLPRGWRERGVVVAFAILIATLALRLVATNGDGVALALFLGALALAAIALNAWGGGRSFCHYACPVGVVERIYTDDAPSLERLHAERRGEQPRSACASCSGCAAACVDLQPERAVRRDVRDDRRRDVTYAFPGVVLAFYTYYALRAGTWEAYFDGRWTEAPASLELAFGPGFYFARELPAIIAAPLTLVAFGVASHTLFLALERVLPAGQPRGRLASDGAHDGGRGDDTASGRGDDERTRGARARVRRQRALALASFAAFNLFYLFAGAPTLRLVPGLSRVVAFVVPVVATLVLVHRLRATEDALERATSPAISRATPTPTPDARPTSARSEARRLPVVAS
ncbi:MAG: 4Fe-4S binding protein [Myxococcales bacterium]|nr:4Fe-4S binding protein [Myxococcales bacterium]